MPTARIETNRDELCETGLMVARAELALLTNVFASDLIDCNSKLDMGALDKLGDGLVEIDII